MLETPKAQTPVRCESRNNVWDYSEVETELNSNNGQSAAKPERGGSETIITQSSNEDYCIVQTTTFFGMAWETKSGKERKRIFKVNSALAIGNNGLEECKLLETPKG